MYPAALRAASVCRGLGFIVEGGAQHELLHAGWDHGEASFLQDKHGAGGDAVFVEAVHGNVVALPGDQGGQGRFIRAVDKVAEVELIRRGCHSGC